MGGPRFARSVAVGNPIYLAAPTAPTGAISSRIYSDYSSIFHQRIAFCRRYYSSLVLCQWDVLGENRIREQVGLCTRSLGLMFMLNHYIIFNHRYVPHANKSLRAFNIYLNVRKPPLHEKFLWNPLSFFFPRPNPQPPTSPIPRSRTGTPRSSRSPSPAPDANINNISSSSSSRRSGSSINSLSTAPVPISPIPPATNPRGELIFSSRIDKSFREPYERYRAAFERRREEKERAARNEKWWEWCPVWLRILIWRTKELPQGQGQGHNRSLSLTPSTSLRGRNSRGGTPTPPGSGSVTRTPTPPSPGTQSGLRSETHSRERSASPSRTRPGFTLQDNTNMRTMALERSANNAP